ncbi:MAG: glycosyltransferase [Anaerolineales bacterium]
MRILIATQTYYPGANGQAAFTIRLAEGLAQLGHEVAVIAPSTQRRAIVQAIRGVRVYGVAALHLPRLHPETYLTLNPEPTLTQALTEFAPEVVHLQDHYMLCESVLRAAQRRGLPVLGTNHFLPDNVLPNFFPVITLRRGMRAALTGMLWRWMLRVFNQLDHVTTPTETAAAILRRQALRVPVTAISCGVDTQRFRPMPELDRAATRARYDVQPDAPLFLYIGRLDREKRLDVMLGAFAQMGNPNARLVIGGRGPAEADLRALSVDLRVAERVTFTGYLPVEALPPLLNAADCFVMPSPQELQSIATIEAMATGRPVIAANARALPELVTHSVNGYLFSANCVEDAAHWMRAFASEQNRWAAMGAASLEWARRHTLSRTLHAYEATYHAAVTAYTPVPQRAFGVTGASD